MSSRAELERILDDNPYDADAFRIYADLLQQAGDPRGELILLQLAAEADPARAADAVRYRRDRATLFLGPLAPLASRTANGERMWWRFGFIHKLRVQDEMAVELEQVLAHPSGRFLAELEVGASGFYSQNLVGLVDRLAALAPRTLRVLKLGIPWQPDPSFNYWHQGCDLSALWPKLPRLKRLVVNGGQYHVGELDLPELETAAIQTGGLNSDNAHALCTAKLPKLTFLDACGDHDDSIETLYRRNGRTTVSRTNGTFRDLAPLLARRDLPLLRHLGIKNALYTDEVCEALGGAALLPQLRELDLAHGMMSDAGAFAMVSHPGAFAHLDRLDVSTNYLTQAGIDAVRQLGCARIITDHQRRDDRHR